MMDLVLLLLAVIVGWLFGLPMGERMHKQTMFLRSIAGTPEKIGNAFYYVVLESEYVRMQSAAIAVAQKKDGA